jgi:uncharacterized protein YdeI (YjbR/CyaY-like superfamily)
MNQKIEDYFNRDQRWLKELLALREIILDCGLEETFKWRGPCYSYEGNNIVLIGGLKDYCLISFVKGALLGDSEKILVQQTENVQSARIIPFSNAETIQKLAATLKAYILEAIEVEKSGLKVAYKNVTDFYIPEELERKFANNSELEKAFNALTPGRQKGYLLYFTSAKQAKTRADRIDKNTQRIMDGYGIQDCTCGLTKRKPNCDGSHKQFKSLTNKYHIEVDNQQL